MSGEQRTRALYKLLLRMHPPAFRQRFAEEMLFIFDEAAPSLGAFALVCDVFVSLVRQWALRSGSWKLVVAVFGAILQITAGGLIWAAIRPEYRSIGIASAPDVQALDGLMQFILVAVGGIVLMVVTASLWMRRFVRRRVR